MNSPESAPDEPSFATQRDPRLRILIPVIVAMAFLMEQLDSTIITTAIPDMARSLGTTPVRLNVAVTAYVLTVAAFIPVSGWFADRFGARRVFIAALLIFTTGSVLCGMADSFGMLVAMRVVQGLGGAMMTPVGRLILLRSFPRSELMTAMMYMSLPAVIGPVAGPLLGGFLTTYISWRWIFYANVPFGIIGVVLALRYLDDVRDDTSHKFDFGGFFLVATGVVLLQFGMENVSHPLVSAPANAALMVAAVLLLLGFGYYARGVAEPVVDLTLFRQRSFAVGTLAGGFCRVAINGMPYLLPLMLQIGLGLSPIASGALTFVGSVGAIFIRPLLSRLLRAFGFGNVLIGSALAASAMMAAGSLIGPATPYWLIVLYVLVFGVTRTVQFMTSNTLAYADTPDEKLSRATSLGGILQQLTVSFGVSLSAMLLSLVSWHGEALTPGHFHEVFLIMAILPLLAIPGFLLLRPDDGVHISGYRKK
jgi:EmrB/QacA subfamily drug resistance transporter